MAFADGPDEYLTIDTNQFQAFMFDINFPRPIFSKQHRGYFNPRAANPLFIVGRHSAASLFRIVTYIASVSLFDFNYLDELMYCKKEN